MYEDTKIRLHFSHFKILPPSRSTCFVDSPHQCPDLKDDADFAQESFSSFQRHEL